MNEQDTIYVALLDEGLDVWRPVAARRLAPDRYLSLDQDYDPTTRTWQFEPGTVVTCRAQDRDGRQILIAAEVARQPASSTG
jgi:hypothetical protein